MREVRVRIRLRTGITPHDAAWGTAVVLWAAGCALAATLPSSHWSSWMDVGTPHIGAPVFIDPLPGGSRSSLHSVRGCGKIEGDQLLDMVRNAAEQHSIRLPVLLSMVAVESAGNPCAVSPKGAAGILQLMPHTARHLGVRSRHDPVQSLDAGARYLKSLLERYGDLRLALAAYNAGPAWVDHYRGVPPFKETQAYVNKVLGGPPTP